MEFIELKNIEKQYSLGKLSVPALRGVNISIQKGNFVTIMGPSGSGKTTLLNLLGLLDEPDAGEIRIDGISTSGRSDKDLTCIRRRLIGFIFQMFNLIPICTVFENIEYPMIHSSFSILERRRVVQEKIEAVGLAGLENRFPNGLSGGQQQRVAIGRALVHSPSILIADEPTANLDSETGAIIIDLLHHLNINEHATIVLATHDPLIIERSDLLFHLRDGQIEDNGGRQ